MQTHCFDVDTPFQILMALYKSEDMPLNFCLHEIYEQTHSLRYIAWLIGQRPATETEIYHLPKLDATRLRVVQRASGKN